MAEEDNKILQQQLFELHKHLTTINTGSLVLVAAVLKDLFANPVKIHFVRTTFVLLMISLGTCLICMFLIVFAQSYQHQAKKKISVSHLLVCLVSGFSLSTFFGAMISFTLFFAANFN